MLEHEYNISSSIETLVSNMIKKIIRAAIMAAPAMAPLLILSDGTPLIRAARPGKVKPSMYPYYPIPI